MTTFEIPQLHMANLGLDRSVWYGGFLLTFLATSEDTGGAFSLTYTEARKGISVEPPLHIHTREEESFYVIEGELVAYVGDEVVRVHEGSLVTLPRGVPHRYTIGSEHARYLNLCTPGGFEGFLRDLSEPVLSMTLPPALDGPPHVGKLVATAARYGIEIIALPGE